jgi:hypothetical protein
MQQSKDRNMRPVPYLTFATIVLAVSTYARAGDWSIDSQSEWTSASGDQKNLVIKNGMVTPIATTATFSSKLHRFDKKRSAASIVFEQSPIWQNWQPVTNIGPSNLQDAPVLLCIEPGNYWMFGRYGGQPRRRKGQKPKPLPPFKAEPATLDGFDVPLQTTRFPNQFNAPGGLKPGKGGYHAWQSRDMKNWVHHGPVTEGFSRWVTSAEWIDGKALIYYDFPNDQDPHVYVDDNLFDGKPGKNMGIAVKDPSHGSDAGFIRDLDGKMHVIIEDWSPINASKRSWDSPLAGHAVSPNGIDGFKFLKPPVDNRTKPTGKIATYKHPHWAKEDPKNYKTNVAEYEVHEPEQEAYGDWAAISIGGQYYLFGDYDPSDLPRAGSTSSHSSRPTSSVPARGWRRSGLASASTPMTTARLINGPTGRRSKRPTRSTKVSRSRSKRRPQRSISSNCPPAMVFSSSSE